MDVPTDRLLVIGIMSVHPKAATDCQDCGATFVGQVSPRPRWCPVCRPDHQPGKRPLYVWTPERDALLRERYDSRIRGRSTEIAQTLGGPAWAIKKRAGKLGLATPWPKSRKAWTVHEVAFLAQWSGRRDSGWIAKRIGRSTTSVVLRQKRTDLRRRVRDGYTLRDLCACFGVDHHVVERWARQGWLQAPRRVAGRTDKQGDPWRVAETDIVTFVRAHGVEIDLRKVDQAWFFDVVVGATVAGHPDVSAGVKRAVHATRRILAECEPDETVTLAEIHARVSAQAHEVRAAVRALLASRELERVYRIGSAIATRRTA